MMVMGYLYVRRDQRKAEEDEEDEEDSRGLTMSGGK